VDIHHASFDGPHGPVPVRIYRSPARDGAGLVWSHGGGWMAGGLDMPEADGVARGVATGLPGVVVSVDYRLAPAHRYPVPVDDVVAAWQGTVARAGDLGIDPRRLAIGGASAGAHLTAVAADRLASASDGPRPAAVVLVYPATDPVGGPYVERPASVPEEAWFGQEITSGLFLQLLGVGVDQVPDGAVPAKLSLADLPPVLVTTAGHDGLAAQAIHYVELLRRAGVDVTHHDEPAAFHGYLNQVGVTPAADAALARHVDWLRTTLRPR
jgi:acetyl esterase/lipase